jgi:hypothetical protein
MRPDEPFAAVAALECPFLVDPELSPPMGIKYGTFQDPPEVHLFDLTPMPGTPQDALSASRITGF